jgi:hypothetical protein
MLFCAMSLTTRILVHDFRTIGLVYASIATAYLRHCCCFYHRGILFSRSFEGLASNLKNVFVDELQVRCWEYRHRVAAINGILEWIASLSRIIREAG